MSLEYKFDVEALPLNWYYYSQRLRESAELIIKYSSDELNKFPYLKNEKSLSEMFFLNYGFAIENAIKGYLISEDKSLTKDYTIDKIISTKHDLVNISKYISKIELTENEKDILRNMTDCITFWGRYPIPKNYTKEFKILEYSPEIHKEIYLLWRKIIIELYYNIRNGWTNSNGLNSGTFRDSEMEDFSNLNINDINWGNVNITTANTGFAAGGLTRKANHPTPNNTRE